MRRAAGTAAVLVVLLALPAAVAAQCPKTTLGDVEDEVMCPICGTPLELATEAPQAQRERELIERLIADCRSKEEVKQVLVAEFGSEVLALPEDEGFDLAAYLVPALGILVGAGALLFAALRWRRRRPGGASSVGPAPAGEASRRLDADIDRYDL
jgi:cytochrome c-type biogenesis protein CcmH